jgi:hypothetical protein
MSYARSEASPVIQWPSNRSLPPQVHVNLERLRGNVALLDLEAEEDTWKFESLPWSEDRPLRLLMRNSHFEPLEITLNDDGTWLRSHPPEVPRFPVSEGVALPTRVS